MLWFENCSWTAAGFRCNTLFFWTFDCVLKLSKWPSLFLENIANVSRFRIFSPQRVLRARGRLFRTPSVSAASHDAQARSSDQASFKSNTQGFHLLKLYIFFCEFVFPLVIHTCYFFLFDPGVSHFFTEIVQWPFWYTQYSPHIWYRNPHIIFFYPKNIKVRSFQIVSPPFASNSVAKKMKRKWN